MARKKTEQTARVRVLVSVDNLRAGEVHECLLTARVEALVAVGFLEVETDGESPAGPGATDPGDSGGEPQGAEAEGAPGTEPGEDPGAGGHGTPEE